MLDFIASAFKALLVIWVVIAVLYAIGGTACVIASMTASVITKLRVAVGR